MYKNHNNLIDDLHRALVVNHSEEGELLQFLRVIVRWTTLQTREDKMGQHQRGRRNSQQGPNRTSQRGDDRGPTRVNLDARVITEGGEILVKEAEQRGRQLARNLTTSQIRNIYGAVKKMQMKGKLDTHKLLMLKPKLAYAAKRHGGGVETLKEVLTQAIDLFENDSTKFNRFCRFL